MSKVYRTLSLMAALVQAGCWLLMLQSFPHHLFGLESNEEKIFALLKTITKIIPVLVILSRFIEGSSSTVIPGILTSIFLVVTLQTGPNTTVSTIFFYLAGLFCLLHLFSIKYFFYYTLPAPTGKFRVGYKSVTHNGLTFAVYFPTEEIGTRKAKYFQDKLAMDKLYALSTIATDMPRFVFDLLFDYLRKLPINAYLDVSLISPEKLPAGPTNQKFVPIIFSHGLGVTRNSYTCLCTELASQGHIVFAPEHMDEVRNILKEPNEGEFKTKHLAKRKSEIKTMLDNIEKGEFLTKIFNRPVPLALDRVMMIGHSFGAATAGALFSEEKRIYDGALFDPWLCTCKKEGELAKPMRFSPLVLESDYWNKADPHYEVRERNQLFMRTQKKNGKHVFYAIPKGVDHATFSDSALYMAPMLKIFGLLIHLGEARKDMEFIANTLRKYVEIALEEHKENRDEKKAEKVMELLNSNKRFLIQQIN